MASRDTESPTPPATLRLVEIFGPTIQGEGPNVGQAAYFLRLAGCNLTCTWCDTAYSWDPSRTDPQRLPKTEDVSQILELLDPRTHHPTEEPPAVTRLVITGGEPLLQAQPLVGLVQTLTALGWQIEIETNGTVSPGPLTGLVHQFNVSPKLAHSGVGERARFRPEVMAEFASLKSSWFKFVARTVEDVEEVASILAAANIRVPAQRIFVVAEGTSEADVLAGSRKVVDAAVARGWGVTPRWHTLLWGNAPGR